MFQTSKQANFGLQNTDCYRALPVWLGRAASVMISKLEGLDHKVTYMGGPCKAQDQLRLADNAYAIQVTFFNFIC